MRPRQAKEWASPRITIVGGNRCARKGAPMHPIKPDSPTNESELERGAMNSRNTEFRTVFRTVLNVYASLILLGTGWMIWPELFWGLTGKPADIVPNIARNGVPAEQDPINYPYMYRDDRGRPHFLTSQDLKPEMSAFNFLNAHYAKFGWRHSTVEYVAFAPDVWVANRYSVAGNKPLFATLLLVNCLMGAWLVGPWANAIWKARRLTGGSSQIAG